MVTLFLSSFTTRPTPIRAVRTSVVKRTKVNVDVKICHDRETRKTLASPLKIIKTQPVPSFSDLVGTGTKTTIPGERALK